MNGPPITLAIEHVREIARPGTMPTTIAQLGRACWVAGVWPREAFRRNGEDRLRRGPRNIDDRALVWWLCRVGFATVPSFPELAAASGLRRRGHATVIDRVHWLAGQVRDATDHPIVLRAAWALRELKSKQGAAA